MGAAIQFTPSTGLPEEQTQFLVAVALSALVYNAFLSAPILKAIFLAATNFMVQILTLLSLSFAVNLAQAHTLF